MGWTIEYTDAAQGQMARLDRPVAQRIARFLEERIAPLEHPRQAGKALQGRPRRWVYRVGNYRVICDIRDEVLIVLVVDIDHRSRVYR